MNIIGYVEDNEVIRENYTECLIEAGFKVVAFDNSEDALSNFKVSMPDLLLLDIGLGHQRDAGLHLCMQIRQVDQSVPIVFLTSHDTDFERISGLRMGADDYITKDTNIDYVLVRIETLLRRNTAVRDAAASVPEQSQLTGSLVLDERTCKAEWKGESLQLSLTQFWILQALVNGQGELKSHNDLMKAANIFVEPNTIAAHVKSIRNAFKSYNQEFANIRTVRGVGYQWIED